MICRPSTPDRGLRWLKEALTRQGVTRDLVDPLTWHFRSLYYSRLRVSTWGSPHPAAIPGQLAYRVQGAKKRGGIDLAQGGIQGGQPEPQVGGSSLDTPSGEHRAAANGALSLRPGTPPRSSQNHHQAPYGCISSCSRTTASGQYRIHLLNQEGTAVGCGWRPKSGSFEDFSPDDFLNEMALYGKRTRCFKSHDLPGEYQRGRQAIGDAPADSMIRTHPMTLVQTQMTPSRRRMYSSPFSRPPIRPEQGPQALRRDPDRHPGILRKWR